MEEGSVSPIIDARAKQMLSDVAVLLTQVRRQVSEPDIRPLADDPGGLVVARRQLTGAIRAVDFGGATETAR